MKLFCWLNRSSKPSEPGRSKEPNTAPLEETLYRKEESVRFAAGGEPQGRVVASRTTDIYATGRSNIIPPRRFGMRVDPL